MDALSPAGAFFLYMAFAVVSIIFVAAVVTRAQGRLGVFDLSEPLVETLRDNGCRLRYLVLVRNV